jgi:hypothetical protein
MALVVERALADVKELCRPINVKVSVLLFLHAGEQSLCDLFRQSVELSFGHGPEG